MARIRHWLLSPYFIIVLLVTGLGGLAHEVWLLSLLTHDRQQLEVPERIELGADASPELVFAKAYSLQQNGDPLEAIRLYGTMLQKGDAHFRARVRYNLGTLYLRDAAKLWKDKGLSEYIRINTLLAAATESLRESLFLEPRQWDARYNLEYAYRITPPPREKPKADFQGSKSSVFATLPALPGGGP